MGNHFHLLLETPEANLISGMRVLLGRLGRVGIAVTSAVGIYLKGVISL